MISSSEPPMPNASSAPGQSGTESSTATWTAERIRALGTVTTVPIAAQIFGLSRSVAYDLIHADGFPVPVLRFGSRYRVPVRAILTALHMPVDPDPFRVDLTNGANHASIDHTQSAAAHGAAPLASPMEE